jgi:FKBP-type peptidyl-prolyl cis-trans isomerase FkpA
MNMIKTPSLLIGFLLLIVCIACDKAVEKETPNGFKFTVVKSGDGILPKPSQFLVFDFTISDSKDSTWNSSYESGLPAMVEIPDSSKLKEEIGMYQMFRMLSSADSVTITLPANKFFKDVYGGFTPPGIDTTLNMSCRLKVKDIIEMHERADYLQKLFASRKPVQKKKDLKKIDDYLAKNNITAQQDTSGIRYVIHKSVGSEKPTASSCVQVSYEGKFLENEQLFDKNADMSFPLSGVIPGWTYSLPLMGVGDSASLYIPSHLAYGPEGIRGAIPPDAVLIFNVKLLGIGAGFDRASGKCSNEVQQPLDQPAPGN